LLEPRSLKPAWAKYRDTDSKRKQKRNVEGREEDTGN
jgi:hypothetical protein